MKTPLETAEAPRAIGPYSPAQVVRLHGGQKMVLTAGQLGIDPASGELVRGGVQAETERALHNVRALLAAAGLGLADVVKTTVYLADLGEFQAMNEVYARFFPAAPPARTTIQAAALPKGARIEVEAVAIGKDL